jgi:hypothetical protein
MIEPARTLDTDMESAIKDPSFFESADVTVQLDGGEMRLHSQIACQRCPFFDGLFNGLRGADGSLHVAEIQKKRSMLILKISIRQFRIRSPSYICRYCRPIIR